MEAWEDVWSMSRELMYCDHVMPREKLYVPKESSFAIPLKYIDVVRQTRTRTIWKRALSMFYFLNIDENKIISENWSGCTRFRILNKRPPKGYSWVDGPLTQTQVASSAKCGRPCPNVLRTNQVSFGKWVNRKYKLRVR